MALESYCASCTYMGTTQYSGKYWCERKGETRFACDPKCYSWCEAYGRSTSARENMYQYSLQYSTGSGCYLTTAMCHVLGYPDNNYYLETLRTFRDNILKQDIKYLPLLILYDQIGPQIAYNLEQDENKDIIAKTMFTKYITPAVTAIEENKTETATNIYVAMTNVLAERYNIDTNIITINEKDINITTLGHGRIRKRVPEQL